MLHRYMHSRGHWGKKVALFMVIGLAVAVGFAFLTMSLWNWLMPELFGLKLLTIWQTAGLLVLSWCFFGRFRHMGHHGRHRIAERWMRMSPEEREKFHDQMHEHWGRHRPRGEPPTQGNAG